jgi:subfamily B ATP-binding cassette protein MsbA
MRDYLKRVLALVKPYRLRFAVGLLCGFLSGALAFTLPLSLKLALDAVFPTEKVAAAGVRSGSAPAKQDHPADTANAPAAKPNQKVQLPSTVQNLLDKVRALLHTGGTPTRTQLIFLISLIPGAMLLRGILGYLNVYMLTWVGIRAANDLRVRLFSHLMNMPMGFFSRMSTGDLMARIEGGMAVNSTINGAIGTIIREPITIVGLVIFLFKQQALLSSVTLVVFPLCLVPVIIYGRKLRGSHAGIHTQVASSNTVLHESFTGFRVVKAYNLESLVVNQFRKAAQAVTGFYMRSTRASELPGPLIEFIGAVGVALIFAFYAFVQPGRAPAGDLLSFFMAVFGLYAPVKNLSRLQSQLTLARASVEPIYELLNTQTNLPEPANPKPLKANGVPIRFENVSFSYTEKPHDERRVLHNIDLTIQPGQKVALVGRTGSGKTSIANLLLRFYDPQEGAILIGDTDIRAVSSRDLRASIAVVTQDTILFNDTIRNNIALGRPGATDTEIEEAAKHAYADEFIKQKGYNTSVGEKGINVSGGQRQRIAIARAILRNAPILILDEATNALDPESEKIVQEALDELMKGRTTICIAHRLSTIQKADLIVVLDHGRIVERGTHAELLRAGGLYSRLHELAFEEVPT